MNYQDFLASKVLKAANTGFDQDFSDDGALFPFQRKIVQSCVKRGRAAIFADTGLGKARMGLKWADAVSKFADCNVLVLTPCAVAQQMAREADNIGVAVKIVANASEVEDGISLCNYEKLHKLNSADFGAIVLDESSILKGFSSKYRAALTEFAADINYRLAMTATPSPNDLIELINHSDWLGIMQGREAIANFFVQDGNTTKKYRLKKTCIDEFWAWVASWAVCVRQPSDLGDYCDDGYSLPPLNIERLTVASDKVQDTLLPVANLSLSERREARKASLTGRVAAVAELVNQSDEPWVVWCDYNDESDALKRAIPDAVEVRGSMTIEQKESAIDGWLKYGDGLCLGKLNTQKHDGKKASQIRSTERSETPKDAKIQKKGRNATKNGAPTMLTTLSDIENQQKTNETLDDESCTRRVKNLELKPDPKLKSGSQTTQKTGSLNDSGNLESLQTSTGKCLNPKMADALFAEDLTVETAYQEGCTSIIVTAQEKFEDCSAQDAILESENSKTTPLGLKEPRSTFAQITEARLPRVLISKPSILGFGLNFQHCHNTAFVGVGDSFEQQYQAIRRFHRFGQKHQVNVFVAASEQEFVVLENQARKQDQHNEFYSEVAKFMRSEIDGKTATIKPAPTAVASGKNWELRLGDNVQRIGELADNSIDLSITSIPFPGMYAYTDLPGDMGNVRDYDEFFAQFDYLLPEWLRVTKPGRTACVHVTDGVAMVSREGYMGLKDFSGDTIRAFQKSGWIYAGKVFVDQDPQLEAVRNNTHGLLFKSLATDASIMRFALADYVLLFRKPGKNEVPIRAGKSAKYNEGGGWITEEEWIEWAAPVWYRHIAPDGKIAQSQPYHPALRRTALMKSSKGENRFNGIQDTDVANVSIARSPEDERHLCPLQYGIIERCTKLFSNPGELILDPFNGVGSTGVKAMELERRYTGFEIKESYYKTALKNLKQSEAGTLQRQTTIFDTLEVA
jgi:DNA modification methylase